MHEALYCRLSLDRFRIHMYRLFAYKEGDIGMGLSLCIEECVGSGTSGSACVLFWVSESVITREGTCTCMYIVDAINLCTGGRVLSLTPEFAFSTLTNSQAGADDLLLQGPSVHSIPHPSAFESWKTLKTSPHAGAAMPCYLFNFSHSGFLFT